MQPSPKRPNVPFTALATFTARVGENVLRLRYICTLTPGPAADAFTLRILDAANGSAEVLAAVLHEKPTDLHGKVRECVQALHTDRLAILAPFEPRDGWKLLLASDAT